MTAVLVGSECVIGAGGPMAELQVAKRRKHRPIRFERISDGNERTVWSSCLYPSTVLVFPKWLVLLSLNIWNVKITWEIKDTLLADLGWFGRVFLLELTKDHVYSCGVLFGKIMHTSLKDDRFLGFMLICQGGQMSMI